MKSFAISLLLATSCVFASPDNIDDWKESDFSKAFCSVNGGQLETRVKGGRIDCETDDRVWEVEYASKWKEGIAQAQWYSIQKNKIPGILFIIRKDSDLKYIEYTKEYLWKTGMYIDIDMYIAF